ncbi:MAG: hypothetical protein JSW58_01030 [Candidatus Latescibacterota bacterium]|nr:MAG: hypothetical protein JSW58_01030 [Candidatus Latescibacterota bacterium]
MKLASVIALVALLGAGAVFGQAGSIGLFSDTYGTNCSLYDQIPGLVSVYAVHVSTSGATACQFRVEDGPGMNMMWLSDTAWGIWIGCSHCPEGIAIPYGICLSSPIHVLTMGYFAQAISQDCSWIRVVPPETLPSGQIEMYDCDSNILYPTGGTLIVNPTDDCQCDVPVDESTWGKIKEMYRE